MLYEVITKLPLLKKYYHNFYFVVIAIFLVSCNNQTKEDMYHAGFKLLESGSVRGAIIYFKNALEKDPNS